MGQQTRYVGLGRQTGAGPIDWVTPENITALDNNYALSSNATVIMTDSNPLQGLMQGDNFSVPIGDTVIGIVLEINRFASDVNKIEDHLITLLKAGAQVGDDKSTGLVWDTIAGWQSYGGPTDLWSETWSPAEINADDFGAQMVARIDPDETGRVDAYRITVYFNSPADTDLTAVPTPSNNFGNVLIGAPSPVFNILLYNNSNTDIIVSALVFNGDFSDAGAPVAVPFTLLANNASGPTSVPIILTPSVQGYITEPDALAVTHDGTNNPLNVPMQGFGVVLVAVFPVNSGPLVALVGIVGSALILQMNPDDLNCEEAGEFTRWYDYGLSLVEKALMRVVLRCQDIGAFTFLASVIMPNRPQVVSLPVTTGSNSDKLVSAFVDLEASDDLLEVTVSREANSGPMMVNNMFHKVEPRGEYVERT